MNGEQLLKARLAHNWEQKDAAAKLKVSQPYLSLLEAGKRPVTERVTRRAASVFNLPPTVLPLKLTSDSPKSKSEGFLVLQLAALGYPKFSHLRQNIKKENPILVLTAALEREDLDSRLVEALPWLVYNFADMNWSVVVDAARLADAQNRLGFLINLAFENANRSNSLEKKQLFKNLLSKLEKSRLFEEDSFRRRSMTETEKAWLKKNRTRAARVWRVLTNLSLDHLVF